MTFSKWNWFKNLKNSWKFKIQKVAETQDLDFSSRWLSLRPFAAQIKMKLDWKKFQRFLKIKKSQSQKVAKTKTWDRRSRFFSASIALTVFKGSFHSKTLVFLPLPFQLMNSVRSIYSLCFKYSKKHPPCYKNTEIKTFLNNNYVSLRHKCLIHQFCLQVNFK